MTVLPNDPSRFWPEDDADIADDSSSSTQTFATMSTQTPSPKSDDAPSSFARTIPVTQRKEGLPNTQQHFIPRMQQKEEKKQTTLAHMVTHAKRVEDGLERLVDDMDTFFKTEMEETEHQPFLPPLTPKESRHTTDDPTETHNTSFHSTSQAPLADDEYGLIRTGSKGPKQTPNGTVVFIIFAVTFILLLTAFLVAFMMNVLH